MGFVYLIRNTVNGKIYVGQTRLTVAARWYSHVKAAHGARSDMVLHHAIRKYGAECFTVTPLAELTEQHDIDEMERFWIVGLCANEICIGYNRDIARIGPRHSVASRAKMSATWRAKNFHHSVESRAKMSASGRGKQHPWSKGKPLGPAHVAKLIAAKSTPEYHSKTSAVHRSLGGHPHTVEHRLAMQGAGNPFFGKTHSLETCEKIRAAALGRPSPNKGKVHTAETRAKMRAAWERRRGAI